MRADLAAELVDIFHTQGVDLAAVGLAWARVAPSVALVPALGLRGAPPQLRAGLGLLLAASIAPALGGAPPASPWAGALLREATLGVPLALGAALPIWIATDAGSVIDALRGSNDGAALPVYEGKRGPFGALFALLACAGFMASGGPARVALAALSPPGNGAPQIIAALASGASIAAAVAAPMLGAAVVVEASLALVARAATPASLSSALATARGAILLVLGALFFDRMAALVLTLSSGAVGGLPPAWAQAER